MTQDQDPLAAVAFTPVEGAAPGAGQPGPDPAAEQQAQQEAQMLQAVSLGVSRIAFAALRALRSTIARSMPEILEEWPDELLRGPADASAPLLQRYFARLAELAGKNPELTMLGISLVPLGMGYLAALEKHQRTVEDAGAKAA